MEEKELGKITFAEFGQCSDRPFLFGLHLCFEFGGGGSGCCDGCKYTVNVHEECKYDNVDDKYKRILEIIEFVDKTLKDAKVNHVSELVNKPVEVTLKDSWFKDFRILTEVI